jgi:15-cis-phytoene synthase
MSVNTTPWERELLQRAYQGYENSEIKADQACTERANDEIARSYQACEGMTYRHSRTFHMASGLLTPAKRRAARALYAFCRTSDDLIDRLGDQTPQEAEAALADWATAATDPSPNCDDPLVLAWTDTQATYNIPYIYARQLIEGVARDLHQTRYQTFTELAAYCYGVASTVGLMAMYIIGFSGPVAIPYAVKLGIALQLTNILQDVSEDWSMGRLYLPLEELAAFDMDETAPGVDSH